MIGMLRSSPTRLSNSRVNALQSMRIVVGGEGGDMDVPSCPVSAVPDIAWVTVRYQ